MVARPLPLEPYLEERGGHLRFFPWWAARAALKVARFFSKRHSHSSGWLAGLAYPPVASGEKLEAALPLKYSTTRQVLEGTLRAFWGKGNEGVAGA
ncbi:MAG: hypothetical protein Kow0069_18440 [Promethearchaeota archaeon]